MEIIYNKNNSENNYKKNMNTKTAVALGNFDGFHIGHMKLIDTIKEYAQNKKNKKSNISENISSCVWTFTEHSLNILKHDYSLRHIQNITTREEKIEILKDNNIDYLIFQDFDFVRNLSPEQFIEQIIAGYLNAEFVVCGYDYRFGKNGEGNAELLRDCLARKNIETAIIPPVMCEGEAVSSSAIRTLISTGDMQRVQKFLGRPFSIDFPVVHGRQIGRTINIPTINQLFPQGHIIPARGVYACTCEVLNKTYKAVTNIGVKPTVNTANQLNAETHLIDFDGDLYGRNIKVNFYLKLRDEIKFNSLDELKEQINKDIESARGYLMPIKI